MSSSPTAEKSCWPISLARIILILLDEQLPTIYKFDIAKLTIRQLCSLQTCSSRDRLSIKLCLSLEMTQKGVGKRSSHSHQAEKADEPHSNQVLRSE